VPSPSSPRPKYRSIDGFGNNLEHPYWGAVDTSFGRFGPKTFADGVNLIRKSDRTYQYLPSPREIVEKVLKVAKKTPRTSNISNSLLIQFLAFIAVDTSDSLPSGKERQIPCCSAGNKAILPRKVRHSSCAPISISKDDSFYNSFDVRCTRFIRSQLVSSPSGVQFGEINETELI
jgi:Animal haem peroxidase